MFERVQRSRHTPASETVIQETVVPFIIVKGEEKQVTHPVEVCGHAEDEAGPRAVQEKNIDINFGVAK